MGRIRYVILCFGYNFRGTLGNDIALLRLTADFGRQPLALPEEKDTFTGETPIQPTIYIFKL